MRKNVLINLTGAAIKRSDFINSHKRNPNDFTRTRVFDFSMVFILILQKSIKSLQLVLNELL